MDFGILYEAEQNSGNDVRRAGDEGLFRTLAEHNIEQVSRCTFNRIMTTDPHTLNALAQDYPTMGMRYEVVHYTQVLEELLESGRLSREHVAPGTRVTFHDPCYLGRYNGSFDSPRRVIETLGFSLQEMPRSRENSFCCGAGGGRIWMDDAGIVERPSESRIKEAIALGGVRYFIVTCPKDAVMYTAAVQALGVSDTIEVKEISELFFAA